MTKITLLGLGAMGSRMGLRLLAAGYSLNVWNRTPARADALLEKGARWAATPRAAAEGADIILSMVRDDAASQAVWLDSETGALAGMHPVAVGLESSTLSLPFVRKLAQRFAEQKRAFIDAPVVGSRPQADAGQLIFLVGGDAATVEALRPFFGTMGGAAHHLGPVGAGAAVKLAANGLFGTQLSALAELLGFLRGAGVDPARALEALGATPVLSPAAKGAGGAMLAGNFAPAFPIALIAKDFRLLTKTAAAQASPLPIMLGVQAVLAEAMARGLGDLNVTGVARLYD